MKKDVKKLLAGLGVASLISAGGITIPGAHAAGSAWSASPSAGSAEVNKAAPKAAAASGWSGADKKSAVSAEEKADQAVEEGQKAVEKKTDEAKSEAEKVLKKIPAKIQ